MAQVTFKRGNFASYNSGAKEADVLYFIKDQGVMYLGEKRFSDIIVDTSEPSLANVLANQIHIYNNTLYFRGMQAVSGGSSGYEDAVIKVDVGNLASEVAALATKIGTIPSTATDVTTVIGYVDYKAKELSDAAEELESNLQDAIDEKVSSVTAADGSVTVSGDDEVTVKVNIASAQSGTENSLSLVNGGLYVPTPAAADTYELATVQGDSQYAAVYQLVKKSGGTGAGTPVGDVKINIPKDMVVQSGTVVTVTDENKSSYTGITTNGTYIELTLANNDGTKIYINVDDLVDQVTTASGENDIVKIVVTDGSKISATVTDGTITIDKLESTLKSKIETATTTSASNKSAIDEITDGEEINSFSEVESKLEELDGKFDDLDDKYDPINSASEVETKLKGTTQDQPSAETIAGAKAFATDADSKLETKLVGNAATDNKDSSTIAGAKKFATDADTALETKLVGTSSDGKDANTINGAKAFATDAITTALSWVEF